jgi:hypothetical protein
VIGLEDAKIIEILRKKIDVPVGRHLYGIIGSYDSLNRFSTELSKAQRIDGSHFPNSISVNKGLLEFFSDTEFRTTVETEAKYPQPTRKKIEDAFDQFIRDRLKEQGLIILKDLELVFAYNVNLNPLRTLAADERKIVLLLPGRRSGKAIIMYPHCTEGENQLPTNLIAEDHLWLLEV